MWFRNLGLISLSQARIDKNLIKQEISMKMKFIKNRGKFVSESLDSEMNVPDVIWEIHSIFNEYKFKLIFG